MSHSTMNVLEVYLNKLRRNEIPAVITLIDGTTWQGRILLFDPVVMTALVDNRETMFLLNNIVSIRPVEAGVRIFHSQDAGPSRHPVGGLPIGDADATWNRYLQGPQKPNHTA